MKLSVLMPVYNEASTIDAAIKRVLDVEYPCEIELVLVNDGSRGYHGGHPRGVLGRAARRAHAPAEQGQGCGHPDGR